MEQHLVFWPVHGVIQMSMCRASPKPGRRIGARSSAQKKRDKRPRSYSGSSCMLSENIKSQDLPAEQAVDFTNPTDILSAWQRTMRRVRPDDPAPESL